MSIASRMRVGEPLERWAAVRYARRPSSDEESLGCLEEYVREWFHGNFSELTPPQQYSFKLISQGKNVIITAPTGSGKTLAGFLAILSDLFRLGERGKLQDSVYCIYISPLKALDNDVRKNLLVPLTQIREIARERGIELPEVRIAVRTGDVPPHEKQRQLKLPPHILVTTPESVAVLLNAPKFVQHLKTVRWVIVDEIHELANNKRGVHLALSLERLREEVGAEFQRIGMGATLHPLEEAARYLVGSDDEGRPRKCTLVDVSWYKPFDLQVMSPVRDIVRTSAGHINAALYRLLDKLISSHTTTLVFTNTRSGTERVSYHLKDRWPERYNDETIGAHHGSLSRDIRLDIEERLKKGMLKAVISSTSLELGIDIGYIDLVAQIGSPKSVTRAVQRIGRSGHKFRDVAKGRMIVLDRDDLVECAVMLRCAEQRRLDEIDMPSNCLDILAQHVVGMGLAKKWTVRDALRVVRRAYPYRNLGEEDFKALLHYLAGHYASLEDRRVYGKIWYDESDDMFGRRGKYTRIIYYLNLGAIPDEVKIDVYRHRDRRYIGGIEEGFLERLRPGDIFVLGGRLYKFRFARGMRCFVDDAPRGAVPTIPSWFSEMLPLSFDLALEVRKFRDEMRRKLDRREPKEKIVKWLLEEYPMDERAANSLYEYFREQYLFTHGKVPASDELLVERTYDLEGRRYYVFHSLFGRRVNEALSRAAAIIASNMLDANVAVILSDNGFAMMVPSDKELDIEGLVRELTRVDLEGLLKANIRRTELMKRRFRHCAARSFLVLRNYKGYKISVGKQQLSSQTLLNVTEEIDLNFPVIKETYREILEDTMDVKKVKLVLDWLRDGKLKLDVISTDVPSPFAHNLIVLGEADIILMEDRKKRLLQLYEAVMKRIK
ncbi:MAG: ATP-dependent helicase [Candidatus Hodarchaeaceae archaeon]|nr:ATP-dependent helicase [Candidatus Hodarchaeaceae archaeon]